MRFTELVGIESPARSRPQALEEAVELYAGPFLEGLSIIGSTNFDEWVLLQRENLHCLAYTAFCRLTTRYFELGEYEKAAAVSSRQVKLEPWEEEGHRSLMKSLAFIGQRSAALVHYQRFKKSLVQELGVEPSPKTAVCYEKIARGGFEPAGTLHKHQIKQIKNPFKGLRPFQEYDADDFFGREALVEECLHFLDPQEKRSRFLAIVGSS